LGQIVPDLSSAYKLFVIGAFDFERGFRLLLHPRWKSCANYRKPGP
jgi:hypothetical protein